MRILWSTFAAPELGAVELGTIEGVEALLDRGHEVHVVVPGSGAITPLLPSGATVHAIPNNPWIIRGVRPTARWLAFNAFVAVPRLTRLMDSLRPDVVLTNTILYPATALAARRGEIPHVWFVHSVPKKEHPFPTLLLGERLTMRGVDALGAMALCVSTAVQLDLSRWVPPSRTRIVRWAAQVPSVAPAARPTDSYRLILLGHKSPGKGQHEALRALRILRARGRDVELDLVGGGTAGYEQQLRELARSLGVSSQVRMLPHRMDGLAFLQAADVALVCSRNDAFPRVTIEAMKLGVPVVVAGHYGLLEQVRHDETGLVYPPGDAEALADEIELLISNPDLGRRLARAAMEWVDATFNLERYGDDLEQALRAALTG